MLILARKLWRARLPSRTLGNLEVQILDISRTDEDIPGWAIPQIYFDYLATGDATTMKKVIYHNAMDIVSLAALFKYTVNLLSNPLEYNIEYATDLISLGKLFEDMGKTEIATHLYIKGLEHPDVASGNIATSTYLDALSRLALINKRNQAYQDAVQVWERAVLHNHLPAHVELAKYYEHKVKDFQKALKWTQTAINFLLALDINNASQRLFQKQWLHELRHREQRLLRKITAQEQQEN